MFRDSKCRRQRRKNRLLSCSRTPETDEIEDDTSAMEGGSSDQFRDIQTQTLQHLLLAKTNHVLTCPKRCKTYYCQRVGNPCQNEAICCSASRITGKVINSNSCVKCKTARRYDSDSELHSSKYTDNSIYF